jgi:hypothetical protein
MWCTLNVDAQRARRNRNRGLANDTLQIDSITSDSLFLDSIGKKKQPLTSPVTYKAKDSIDISENFTAQLFGESQVNYENIELTAELITLNMDSSTVYARGVEDSTGVESGTPVFKDSDTPYESKIMR